MVVVIKAISLLLFTLLASGTPSLPKDQVSFNVGSENYPGFSLDLNAQRLVQMEGQAPVWITELEKVILFPNFDIVQRITS